MLFRSNHCGPLCLVSYYGRGRVSGDQNQPTKKLREQPGDLNEEGQVPSKGERSGVRHVCRLHHHQGRQGSRVGMSKHSPNTFPNTGAGLQLYRL